jgi:two-component system, chemotaxis family, chemotaxis protein CheY
MKTLVVEDVCMMRNLLKRLLSPYGKCDTVEDGREALIKFNQAWTSEDKYDVIFLDLMLPEISGDEVLKEIRDLENYMGVKSKEQVKIIICSALSDYENVIKVVKSQCDAYISKPFDKKTIFKTLKKVKLVTAKDIKKAKEKI